MHTGAGDQGRGDTGSGKQGRGLDQVVILRKDGNVGFVDNLETAGGKQDTWAFGMNA